MSDESTAQPRPVITGSAFPQLFADLAAPFEPSEIKSRNQAGRTLLYVTARTVMNRLDQVLGPENWWDTYFPGENSVMCTLTIRLPDGTTLSKSDAGGYAGMADSGDDEKSGYSDSFKRAAVKLGVSRYLYRDGVPPFIHERLEAIGQDCPALHRDGERQHANGHAPAPRSSGHHEHREGQAREGEQHRQYSGGNSPPRTGKALFAWTKEQEQRHGVGLLKYMNNWAKLQEFPGRMIDWDSDQVSLAHAEAMRKIGTIQNGQDSYEEALTN